MNDRLRSVEILALVLFVGTPTLSQPTQSRFNDALNQAQEAQVNKDYKRAAHKYREAAELSPSPSVYEKLGLACFLANSFPEAVEAFSHVIRTDPKRWASQLYLGISLYKTDRFQKALPHVQQALELNPQQNDARYWLGCTYHALGNYGRAIEHLRVALSKEPENLDILYALTETYLDFSTILSKRLGPNTLKDERKRTIEKQIDSALLEMPRKTESWEGATMELQKLEDRFSEVLESRQSDPEGLYGLSRVYGHLGQAVAQRLWQLKPDSYRSHQLLGEVYENVKNYEAAVKEYREALRLNPSAPGLHYAIGQASWRMKRFDDAIPELEAELALNPYHPSANYVLGHIYVRLGGQHAERAALHLERAVEAKPDFVEARKQWGRALSLLGENERAARELKLVAEQEPEDGSVHYLLATIYKKMGLQDKAQKELQIFSKLRAARPALDETSE
jgi:tetratricopeptide (TPR) repeat protein